MGWFGNIHFPMAAENRLGPKFIEPGLVNSTVFGSSFPGLGRQRWAAILSVSHDCLGSLAADSRRTPPVRNLTNHLWEFTHMLKNV
jgi:hypothetical protein